MLNKQTFLGGDTNLLKDSIACISHRRFFGASIFPLPSYILFVLGAGRAEVIFELAGVMFHGLACLLVIKAYKMFSRRLPLLAALLFLACSAPAALFKPADNLAICLFFTSSFLFTVMARSAWCASILAGMALSSGPHGLACIATMAVLSAASLYRLAINPRNSAADIASAVARTAVQTLVVPASLFLLVMSADLRVRNTHSIHSRAYPLEFQSTLGGFAVENALHPAFNTTDEQATAGSTDAYVMDRSIVSVMNAKHRGFLTYAGSGAQPGQARRLEIQKIHESEFENEEPRFITNGDIVKLKSAAADVFLGLTNKEDSEDKLIDASFGVFPGDNDFWRVECPGELKARAEAVKFVHVNTGLILCCTRIKGMLHMHGSVYSERSSRLFYITHNANHVYYKNNFRSQNTRAKAGAFPAWGRMARLCGFVKSAAWVHADAPPTLPNALLRRLHAPQRFIEGFDRGVSCLSLSASLLLTVLLFLNHVSCVRFGVSFQVSRLAGHLLVFLLLNAACIPFLGLDRHHLTFCSLAFNFSVLPLPTVHSNAAISAIQGHKKLE